jgi:hypothetical protein
MLPSNTSSAGPVIITRLSPVHSILKSPPGKWTSTDRPEVRIQWLDLNEVAAVHAEFDWDGADSGKPLVYKSSDPS